MNRGRTNTPLQALTLLNDPAYAEMALALADRVLSKPTESEPAKESDSAKDDDQRLAYMIELAVSRPASAFEISILKSLLNDERAAIKQDDSIVDERTKVPFDAMKLQSQDRNELAAWFAVANAVLNLDEIMSQ